MGKYRELSFGITQTINDFNSLGLKKSEMIDLLKSSFLENGGLEEDWQEVKQSYINHNPYIRSCGSLDLMRSKATPFVEWAKENGIKKFEKVTREDCCNYLKYRENVVLPNGKKLSAWTISADLHFLNKIIIQTRKEETAPITKKELGLSSRKLSDIQRGINLHEKRPGLNEKCKDQFDFIRGCGARRYSIEKGVDKSAFIRSSSGELLQVHLKEKNGRERDAYILPQYRDRIEEIIRQTPGDRLFGKIDKHANYHQFRKEYAQTLINQLTREREQGLKPYQNGEIERQGHLNTHDAERYHDYYRGYDISDCLEVSSALGHSRLEVLKNYLRT